MGLAANRYLFPVPTELRRYALSVTGPSRAVAPERQSIAVFVDDLRTEFEKKRQRFSVLRLTCASRDNVLKWSRTPKSDEDASNDSTNADTLKPRRLLATHSAHWI